MPKHNLDDERRQEALVAALTAIDADIRARRSTVEVEVARRMRAEPGPPVSIVAIARLEPGSREEREALRQYGAWQRQNDQRRHEVRARILAEVRARILATLTGGAYLGHADAVRVVRHVREHRAARRGGVRGSPDGDEPPPLNPPPSPGGER